MPSFLVTALNNWCRLRLIRTLIALLCSGSAVVAHAQVGAGWIATSFTKRIHQDDETGLHSYSWTSYHAVGSGTPCADYTYNSTTDTETFRIFDSRSNRSEIRLNNDYSNGIWQFEGYVKFDAPLHDECLFQIFGNTGASATFLMMRGYRDNGGTIRVMSGSNTIASGIYGVETRINVIHQYNVSAKFYVNGVFKYQKTHDDPGVTNYWKYGCYGTTNGNVPAVVEWRRVRTYRDGSAPDATVSVAPNRITVAPGGGATTTVNVAAFGGNTTLSLSGVPSGAIATLSPTTVTDGQGPSTLTITTNGSISTGSYPITITATNGGTVRNTTLTLN